MVRSLFPLLLATTAACHGRFTPNDSDPRDSRDSEPDAVEIPAEGAAWRLLPEGEQNQLLPIDVAVDSAHRKALTVALSSTWVGRIDLDSGEVDGWFDRPDDKAYPTPLVDGLGTLWVTGDTLDRLDPETGEFEYIDTGSYTLRRAIGLPEGGVLAMGHDLEDFTLRRYDAEGELVLEVPLEQNPVSALAIRGSGNIAVLLSAGAEDGSQIIVVNPLNLETGRTCPVEQVGGYFAELPDGSFAIASSTSLSVARCDDGEDLTLRSGRDNKEIFAFGSELMVLDRKGDEKASSIIPSVARRFDSALQELGQPWPTGKNSGFGDLDAETGLLWMNSEGTTEVLAMDPGTGAIEHRVRLGRHIEFTEVDPAHPERVYVTGRLSNTVGWLDVESGAFVERTIDGRWPRSPVLREGELFVVDHFTGDILVLDPESLEDLRLLDLALPENDTLFLDLLRLHPDGERLVLTLGDSNHVLLVDPEDGAILQDVPVPSEFEAGMPDTSVFELVFAGDAMVTYTSPDGVLARIEPDGTVSSTTLSVDLRNEMLFSVAPRVLGVSADGARIWVGGHAFDAVTLQALPDSPLDVDRVVSELPDGRMLGWRFADNAALLLDAEGRVLDSRVLGLAEDHDPNPSWQEAWGGRLLYTDYTQAEIEVAPLAW